MTPTEKRSIAIFAIHGGGIEPGTTQIARAIAGADIPVYIFEKERIPSFVFVEPDALHLASEVDVILSVHGERNRDASYVMMGGLDTDLVRQMEDALHDAGFSVMSPPKELTGTDPENICNKGKSGRGVQMEISRHLREELYADSTLMNTFTTAVRRVIR
jgi:phage replication-related protein YjqB (UPF0714/DUF867 family)